jgi:hypothetical protein
MFSKKNIFIILFNIFFTVFLVEICLRILPYIVTEPLKSLLIECSLQPLAKRRKYSGWWTKKPVVAFLLPKTQKADAVVVGDSFVFGSLVAGDSTLPACLARISKQNILNLGMSGTQLPDYNRTLEVAMRYQPKKIIYCIYVNDFHHTSPIVSKLDTANTYKWFPETDMFVPTLSQEMKLYSNLKELSYFFRSYELFNAVKNGESRGKFQPINISYQNVVYRMFNQNFAWELSGWDNPKVRQGFANNLAHIAEAQRFLQSQSIDLQVVLIPSKEMVIGQLVTEKNLIYQPTCVTTYQNLCDSLQKMNIPSYDLTNDLVKLTKNGHQIYFSRDIHFTTEGHREVAKLLAKKFF